MEKFQRELTDQALKKIVSTLRQVLYRIETKECKDVVGLLEPYMDAESYQNIRETYFKYQQQKQLEDDNNEENEDNEEDEEDNLNNEENEQNNNNNENDNENNEDENNNSNSNKHDDDEICYNNIEDMISGSGIDNISQKYLLQIQNVAARLVSSSTASASTSNGGSVSSSGSGHNYNRIADRSRNNENGETRKKRKGASKGFPLNWNLIISMLSNISLEQVQSMINVLIMVLSRTPITVLFKQLHEYKFILSSFFDLLNAILRGDIKDIGTCLIIAVIGVIRFSQRKNLTLITTLEVAKYLYNSGNKKKFSLIRSVSLVAFLSNLFKLVNPPPVTPLDVIQLVKSQIQSRL